jgi:AcrR family transcriptional regulator
MGDRGSARASSPAVRAFARGAIIGATPVASLYAAFGSKEALYVEALTHYGKNYDALAWGRFYAAGTAREAVEFLLLDSAASLTGCIADNPRGCMVALSAVGSEGAWRPCEISPRRDVQPPEGAPEPGSDGRRDRSFRLY